MRPLVCAVVAMLAVSAGASGRDKAHIAIDYPGDGSIFPPEFPAPIFTWHDATTASEWLIRISFADGTRPSNLASAGEGMRIGPINPRCVGETNEPSALTPEQAAAHTWTPDAKTWETIKRHSVSRAAVIYITGIPRGHKNKGLSLGRVTIETSKDPVGAPIFYRDVALMPSEVEKGVIKPPVGCKANVYLLGDKIIRPVSVGHDQAARLFDAGKLLIGIVGINGKLIQSIKIRD